MAAVTSRTEAKKKIQPKVSYIHDRMYKEIIFFLGFLTKNSSLYILCRV